MVGFAERLDCRRCGFDGRMIAKVDVFALEPCVGRPRLTDVLFLEIDPANTALGWKLTPVAPLLGWRGQSEIGCGIIQAVPVPMIGLKSLGLIAMQKNPSKSMG